MARDGIILAHKQALYGHSKECGLPATFLWQFVTERGDVGYACRKCGHELVLDTQGKRCIRLERTVLADEVTAYSNPAHYPGVDTHE